MNKRTFRKAVAVFAAAIMFIGGGGEVYAEIGEDWYETFPFIITKEANEDGTVNISMMYMKDIPDDAKVEATVVAEDGTTVGEYRLTRENDRIILESAAEGALFDVTIDEFMDGEKRIYTGTVEAKAPEKNQEKTSGKRNTTSATQDGNTEEKREKSRDEKIEESLNRLSEKSVILIEGNSKKYSFRNGNRSLDAFKFSKTNFEEQKELTKEFVRTVLKMAGNNPYEKEHTCKRSEADRGFYCSIDTEYALQDIRIVIRDEHMEVFGECYYVEDTEEILEYAIEMLPDLYEAFDRKLKETQPPKTWGGKIDFENRQFINDTGREAFEYREKIEFDIELDESFEDTLLEEYADIGEEVHCTLQNIWQGSILVLLKIEGSKKSGQFWQNITSGELGGGFSGGETGRKLRFLRMFKVEDGICMIYDTPYYQAGDYIEVQGSLKNKSVSGVTLRWNPGDTNASYIPASNWAEGFNIDYSYYGTAEDFNDGRNLYKLFGIEAKEIEIPKILAETKDLEEQNPERYVTELRYEEDGEKLDYYIGFIAQADVDFGFGSGNAPAWYKRLGDDVKVTLLGLTQTLNGRDRRNWQMLRFSGTKGTKWFNLGMSEASEALSKRRYDTGEELSVYMEFDELISFNGERIVRNTVEYDTAEATVKFKKDGSLELESIEFGAGARKASVSAKDIKYIGGCEVEYEKLW